MMRHGKWSQVVLTTLGLIHMLLGHLTSLGEDMVSISIFHVGNMFLLLPIGASWGWTCISWGPLSIDEIPTLILTSKTLWSLTPLALVGWLLQDPKWTRCWASIYVDCSLSPDSLNTSPFTFTEFLDLSSSCSSRQLCLAKKAHVRSHLSPESSWMTSTSSECSSDSAHILLAINQTGEFSSVIVFLIVIETLIVPTLFLHAFVFPIRLVIS